MTELAKLLKESGYTVFFGGAGVSTESGIPDFRSADGLYSERYGSLSPETIISASFFRRDPAVFYEYYRSHLIYPDAKPNRAHTALAALEGAGYINAVITQNIDGLHSDAGSRNVLELHGTARENRCLKCGKKYGIDIITGCGGVPRCGVCGGIIKPCVTLYEEALPDGVYETARDEVSRARLLIVGGTSLAVYPAAWLLEYFHGDAVVVINYTPTPADRSAALVINGSVGEALDAAASELCKERR